MGTVLAWVLFAATVSAPIDAVVAAVEGEPVLLSDLDHLRTSMLRQGEPPGSDADVLERKIEDLLIARRAAKLEIDVSEREIDETIDRVAADNHMARAELLQAVSAQGLEGSDYRGLLREQLLRMRIVQREIEPLVRVDRADMIAYMRAHPERYSEPPAVDLRVRRVEAAALSQVLPACARAEACLGRDLTPQSRDDVLRDLAPVRVLWRDLDPALQEWVGSAPAGESARLFPSGDGAWLVVAYVGSVAGRPLPLEDIEDEVAATVRREKMEAAFRQWLVELKTHARIDRFALP